MAGQFVTSKRILPTEPFRYRYKVSPTPIDPDSVQWQDATALFPGLSNQETYSWRTTNTEDPLYQGEVDSMTAVTRNGFTTSNPEWDKGHAFWTRKQEVKMSHPNVDLIYFDKLTSEYKMYQGSLVPNVGSFVWPTTRLFTKGESSDLGQRAILGSAPAQPQANVATSLLELISDGLPSGIGVAAFEEQAHIHRMAGAEYLNAQFGWLPLISDIRKAVTSLMRADSILSQLQRDSGRIVRRRFSFEPQMTTAVTTSNPSSTPLRFVAANQLNLRSGSLNLTHNTRSYSRAWFAGAFSYYFPGFDSYAESVKSYQMMAQVLLGSDINPSVLWEIAPWSWLLDWKFKVGQMLSSAQLPADGLVVRYGYLMRHTTVEVTSTPTIPVSFRNGWDVLPSITLRSELKERVQSTPYGFGTDLGTLTAKQWSILAALGMTKSPRTLRQVT